MIFTIVGWTAAILTGIQFFPQVFRTYMTRHVKGLSATTFTLLGVTASLWLIYGFSIPDYTIITANAMILGCSIALISMKVIYREE